MGRRIAFCADGTWDGVSNDTNVYKISNAIVDIPGVQYSFYDNGVGADGTPIEKLLGGAFGTGLFQKIKDGYSKIAGVYEDGDEVYLRVQPRRVHRAQPGGHDRELRVAHQES